MQALGDVGYQKAVDDFLNIAQEIMALLEASFDDLETFLVGRAAKGFCDGGTTLHIRMYTKQSVGLIAARLVDVILRVADSANQDRARQYDVR